MSARAFRSGGYRNVRLLALLAFMLGVSVPVVRADHYDAVFDAADRVAVVAQDVVLEPSGRYGTQVERLLYESSAAADLEALRGALRATPEEGKCACIASIEIHLYRGNDRLATVAYLGERANGDLWDGDVHLVSHEALLRWFDERGIDDPRRDAIASAERSRQDALLEERWRTAMPPALRPHWLAQEERMRRDPVFEMPAEWRHVLRTAYPDDVERAAVLLRWFGYGGPWTGFHSYESVAETLLRELPMSTLLVAIEENTADGAVLEGAARLVSAYDFGDARALVPPHFRRLLLARVREGDDADKRARAESALDERAP